MKTKGYIISLSAIILLSSLLLFAMFYSENSKQRNIEVNEIIKYSKLDFIKDDLSFDLNRLLQTEIQINRKENLELVFREKIPSEYSKKTAIQNLKNFIETKYSELNNAEIKLNNSRINNSVLIKFSNKLIYEYNFNENSIEFYAENTDTNLVSADLNLTVHGTSTEVILPIQSTEHNLIINFNYVDENTLNETHKNLKLDSRINNIIRIRFSNELNDEIEINLGRIQGKINAVKVWNKTLMEYPVLLELKTETTGLNVENKLNIFADLDLNYSQTDFNSNSLIELNQFS